MPSCTWTVNNAETGGGGTSTCTRRWTARSTPCSRASRSTSAPPDSQHGLPAGHSGSDNLPAVPSNILGTGLVSPLNMAGAYATFAENGVRHKPLGDHRRAVSPTDDQPRSTPDDHTGTQVIPACAATEMNAILKDNVTCALGLCTGGVAQISEAARRRARPVRSKSHKTHGFAATPPCSRPAYGWASPRARISMIPAGRLGQLLRRWLSHPDLAQLHTRAFQA